MNGEMTEPGEEVGSCRLQASIMSGEMTEPGSENARRRRSGQSSMLLVVIVIMIFVGLAVFLLGLVGTIGGDEFNALYVNNLLLSMMRTDTGYTDSKCKLVSDLVFCAYFTPEWQCGPDVPNCLELANSTIARYMAIFGDKTKYMNYLFTVAPAFVVRDPSGEPISLDLGDASLKKSRTGKIYSHPLVISKTVGPNQYTLKIQLIVSGS